MPFPPFSRKTAQHSTWQSAVLIARQALALPEAWITLLDEQPSIAAQLFALFFGPALESGSAPPVRHQNIRK